MSFYESSQESVDSSKFKPDDYVRVKNLVEETTSRVCFFFFFVHVMRAND